MAVMLASLGPATTGAAVGHSPSITACSAVLPPLRGSASVIEPSRVVSVTSDVAEWTMFTASAPAVSVMNAPSWARADSAPPLRSISRKSSSVPMLPVSAIRRMLCPTTSAGSASPSSGLGRYAVEDVTGGGEQHVVRARAHQPDPHVAADLGGGDRAVDVDVEHGDDRCRRQHREVDIAKVGEGHDGEGAGCVVHAVVLDDDRPERQQASRPRRDRCRRDELQLGRPPWYFR